DPGGEARRSVLADCARVPPRRRRGELDGRHAADRARLALDGRVHLAASRPRDRPGVRPRVRRNDWSADRAQRTPEAGALSEPTHNPGVQHETSDVNVRAVFAFGGGLLATGFAIYFIIWLLFGYFSARPTPTSAEQYPLAAGQSPLPPEPRLQVTPR